MTDITNKETAEQLKRYIEGIENYENEKKEITERIAEVYAEAKSTGFDVKTIREIIKIRKTDKDKLLEAEFLLETYLEAYKASPIIACVLDSYDIFKAVDFITSGRIKEKIESDEYPIFVIRPDSGSPIEVIGQILQIMETNKVKMKQNSKGYWVFDKYRIIWGDGITVNIIDEILEYAKSCQIPLKGYSAENFAFGSGGDLMQNVNRDTCKFAIKCSAIKIDGEWRDVYKEPITDKGKTSLEEDRIIQDLR